MKRKLLLPLAGALLTWVGLMAKGHSMLSDDYLTYQDRLQNDAGELAPDFQITRLQTLAD